MKKNVMMPMLAAAMLAAMSSCCGDNGCKTECTDACTASDAVIENIMTRTSVRAYTDQAVSDTLVETMLRAAMAAPTAVNKQPWAYVVATDRAVLDSLSTCTRGTRMAASAPLAIVVCGNLEEALPDAAQGYWIQDASAATENLLLAAHALGLGAVWCGVAPIEENIANVRRVLALPENIVPLNVVVIGHPAENPEPKDKWKPEKVHYNAW